MLFAWMLGAVFLACAAQALFGAPTGLATLLGMVAAAPLALAAEILAEEVR